MTSIRCENCGDPIDEGSVYDPHLKASFCSTDCRGIFYRDCGEIDMEAMPEADEW